VGKLINLIKNISIKRKFIALKNGAFKDCLIYFETDKGFLNLDIHDYP